MVKIWLCKRCGNKTDFSVIAERIAYIKERQRWRLYIDEDGNINDDEFIDAIDSETTDTSDDDWVEEVRCGDCDWHAYDVSDDEWEAWIEGKPEDEQPSADPECRKLNDLKEDMMG